jgi:hypothetical protein
LEKHGVLISSKKSSNILYFKEVFIINFDLLGHLSSLVGSTAKNINCHLELGSAGDLQDASIVSPLEALIIYNIINLLAIKKLCNCSLILKDRSVMLPIICTYPILDLINHEAKQLTQ